MSVEKSKGFYWNGSESRVSHVESERDRSVRKKSSRGSKDIGKWKRTKILELDIKNVEFKKTLLRRLYEHNCDKSIGFKHETMFSLPENDTDTAMLAKMTVLDQI